MSFIGIDFETRSEVDLNKHGAVKYFAGKKADIVFLTYEIDGGETQQWFPHEPIPEFMHNMQDHHFYAFNALFEFRAWNLLGIAKYNYPELKLSQITDVMALCGRFTYHQSLEMAGDDLNLKIRKDKRGKMLIKKICTPPFDYTHQEFYDFMQYGKDDVLTMREMLYALPAIKLSDKEQRIWMLTQKINIRGLPIDLKATKQIIKVTDAYKIEQNRLLPTLTDGNVTKATQRQRIVNWIRRKGITLPNLTADTVSKMLDRLDLPDDVRTVLELRQELGRSSTAKYMRILEQAYLERIYDNLRYYGANTGRWAGMGFQLHNLPRSKVENADPIIDSFYDLSAIEDNPIGLAKSIIRGMICAPPGKWILASDYKSVENRFLAWVCGDLKTIELFRRGLDQYIDMAMHVYSLLYEDVNDDQRQFGKMLILGCGYGLGWKGFIANAAGWGVYITPEESQKLVGAYRERYNKVVKYWYACRNAAINAVTNPGKKFEVGPTNLVWYKMILDKNRTPWLMCMLPSGRALYYNTPMIVEGEYGPELSAMGINPYTKKWMRLKVIPGRLVENIVQGSCRDLLADGKLALDAEGEDLIGSVHDEVILEIEDHKNTPEFLEHVNQVICNNSPWAKGLPLEAEGFIGKRYRKM